MTTPPYSEADTRQQLIDARLRLAGWDLVDPSQVIRELDIHVPMRGARGGHKYYLVHASKSLKGYSTMKEAVSQSLNRTDQAPFVRNRMRQDLRIPLQEVLATVQRYFGGRTVRWSGDSDVAESVKWFLLEDTAVFNFQSSEIKRTLKDHGWLRRIGRVEQCMVPSD